MPDNPPKEKRPSPSRDTLTNYRRYCCKFGIKHSKKLECGQDHKKDIEYPFIPSWNNNGRNDAHKLIIPSQMPIPGPVAYLESIAETI